MKNEQIVGIGNEIEIEYNIISDEEYVNIQEMLLKIGVVLPVNRIAIFGRPENFLTFEKFVIDKALDILSY